MTSALAALAASPDRYLFAFERDEAIFLPVDRDVYARSIFLDDRIALDSAEAIPVPMAALAEYLQHRAAAPPRTAWIFHIAHCGSTLLARALDRREATLVLREPLSLRQLGVDGADETARSADWQTRLTVATALLGRRYRPDAPAIVKANVPVNFLLADLLARDPQAPGILLYYLLEPYLLAVLRSDGHRGWIARICAELEPAIVAAAGPIAGLSTADKAAMLWLAQIRRYAEALGRFPQLRSLDADTLFADPASTLRAAFDLFCARVSADEVTAIIEGELFTTHAKNPGVRFDNAMRIERQAERARTLRPEIDSARALVDRRLRDAPLPDRLSPALTGEPPLLLPR